MAPHIHCNISSCHASSDNVGLCIEGYSSVLCFACCCGSGVSDLRQYLYNLNQPFLFDWTTPDINLAGCCWHLCVLINAHTLSFFPKYHLVRTNATAPRNTLFIPIDGHLLLKFQQACPVLLGLAATGRITPFTPFLHRK